MPSARALPSRPSRPRACSMPRKRAGLPVKLHADQLSNLHGARLAAEHGALSADHLEYTDEDGVAAMAERRHGRGAAARRVLRAARETAAAGRGVAPPSRANRDRDRQQSRHLADDLAAADHEHGGDAVPSHRRGMPSPASPARPRARSAGSRISVRWSAASAAILRSGIDRTPGRTRLPHRLQSAARAGVERPMTYCCTHRRGALALRLAAIARGAPIELADGALAAVAASAATVAEIVATGDAVYGINTGFGKLANMRIERQRSRDAATQSRAVACGRRRRADAGSDRAPDDGAQAREPGARRFGRAPRDVSSFCTPC